MPEPSPKELSEQMLSRVFDQLPQKDMSKDAFIQECTEVIRGKKKRKHSPLVLPSSMN